MNEAERLLEFALGVLPSEERQKTEAKLRTQPALRDELDRISASLEPLHEASLADAAGTSTANRARLMSALEGPSAFLPFLDEIMELFDLDEASTLDVLALADGPRFEETGVEGVRYLHFQPGPGLAGVEAGLVHFDAYARFPEHVHRGRELTYVLRGTLRFSDGRVLMPGDQALLEGGRHSVSAGDEDVLYLTYHEGFDLG